MHPDLRKEFQANTSGFMHAPLFTKFKKLTPILLFIAIILFFIAYGVPYWAESTELTERREHFGLWRYCSHVAITGNEICDDFININYNDWLKTAQSFMTLAMFAFFVTLPAFIALVFVDRFEESWMTLLGLGSAGTTAGLLIIGMCSFAFRYDEYFYQHDSAVPPGASQLSWGFYLCLTCCLLTICAPILVIVEVMANKYMRLNTSDGD